MRASLRTDLDLGGTAVQDLFAGRESMAARAAAREVWEFVSALRAACLEK